uniref:Uncharacterized protein n=1 Tax=Arundo donax TaxID=35708 RepID=A0A0A9AH14_ARUDO
MSMNMLILVYGTDGGTASMLITLTYQKSANLNAKMAR